MDKERGRIFERWVGDHVGYGRTFRHLSDLTKAARVDYKTAKNIMETGKANPHTLVKLARAAGDNPVDLLILMGVLDREDLEASGKATASGPALVAA